MNLLKKLTEAPAKHVELININFAKPWWHIFVQLKSKIVIIIFATTITNVLNTLLPILIGWILNTQSFYNLSLIIGMYCIEGLSNCFIWNPRITQLYSQTMESFRYSAYKTLLGIDPIYHAQSSSGVGVGKIRRTMDAYRDITKNLFDELIPVAISLITAIIALTALSPTLGIAIGIGMIFVSAIFGWGVVVQTREIEKQANHDDDRANHVGTESLIRAPFIRGAFASDQVRERLTGKHTRVARSMTTLFMTYRLMRSLFVMTYNLGIGCATAFLLYLIKTGSLTPVTALSLIVTILRSTQPLLKIDSRVRETVSAYRKIEDFYRFVRRFGQRTFPVFSYHLPESEAPIIAAKETIRLKVTNITVAYPKHRPIFTNLSLNIQAERAQSNKLYGIIGPSGVGKTTLVSLIGGQLKPPIGSVEIDGYNIYELSDKERQQLIALQGQTATSLHGTLRYNLTFGLPPEHRYKDGDLIGLLRSVGLWTIFKEKQGLQTLVGEGGTTLSGGQRQRLNFANLYLRAQTYKPSVILIDEPTSSLDEISEQKITEMIRQLAETSLTLVIAHRLKTLEDAEKILDLCMLDEHEPLRFYAHEQLISNSEYYQKLVAGIAPLEE